MVAFSKKPLQIYRDCDLSSHFSYGTKLRPVFPWFYPHKRNTVSVSLAVPGKVSSSHHFSILTKSFSFICCSLICKSIPSRTPMNCPYLPRYSHGPLHHSNCVSLFVLRACAHTHIHWITNLHLNLQRIWGISLFPGHSLVLMPKTSLQAVFLYVLCQ